MRQYDDEDGRIFAKALPDEALPDDIFLDKAWREFCSSSQEARELEKIASLLAGLPRVQPSSSFQSELKASLLEKSQAMLEGAGRKKKKSRLFVGMEQYFHRFFSRSINSAAVAAAVVAIIALTVFYNQGATKPGPGKHAPLNPFIAMFEQNEQEQVAGEENLPPAEKKALPGDLPDNKAGKTGLEEDGPAVTSPVSPGQEGEVDPPSQGLPPGKQEAVAGERKTPDQFMPPEPENDPEVPLKTAPVFSVEKNMRSIKLAGKINIPPVYYNTTRAEAAAPLENVNYAWKPRKTIASMAGAEVRSIGTPAWAQEILSNEGFSIREGDLLVTNYQETQKGNFVEIFYSSQKSGEPGPKLILHYEEGKGIINYYYQEQGGIWQPGFYPLLSPAQVFARAKEVEWYASAARLDFTFQEVFFTYYDFLVEEKDQRITRRLPAYCFIGRDTFQNSGELQLYLPAVP